MTTIDHWKVLWEKWDLRLVILLSLLLQIILIFFGPLRKRTSTAYIAVPMWFAYLLADITANFAVGLISRSQFEVATHTPSSTNPELLAFWAPFLLVHLGGPDTITAFALEDNELWLRHLLGLGFQCWAVIYAFTQSLLVGNERLWLPTVLMFIAGLIKYTERTYSLYLASSRRFRQSLLTDPDPGPNYAKLMDEYTSKLEAKLPANIEMIAEPKRVINTEIKKLEMLTDLQVVQRAYGFFQTFKGLIADLIFSFRERSQSRDFFLKRTPRDAFKVVEVELNFFYEILYTKVVVVQGKFGYPLRIISFCLNCAALVLFKLINKKKEGLKYFETGITYTLLIGAIALDIVAFVMALSSDWTVVALTKSEKPSCFEKFLQSLLRANRDRWPNSSWRIMKIVHRRWSESLSQFNVIDYCLRPRSKIWGKIIDFFGLTNMLDGLKYVETVDFTEDLRDFIFKELSLKSEMADDLETAKEINSARGDWILRFENCSNLLPWINEVDFDESILLWHIATELCFNDDKIKMEPNTSSGDAKNTKEYNGRLSKRLSDYMIYLLIMQSTLMSTVAGIGQIRFRDTCAEAQKFFRGRKIERSEEKKKCCPNIFCFGNNKLDQGKKQGEANMKQELGQSWANNIFSWCRKGDKGLGKLQTQACNSILDVNTAVKPVAVKGDRSKSVLFDACILAKELRKLGEDKKWEIMSKVWVELMSYAACRCRPYTHASQLSKGGQLITLVWLLMSHMGLGDQFQINEGHARAKLIVGK